MEVTQRPRFRKYFPIADVQTLLEKLQARSTTIKVTSEIEICRDPEDNFLLALAKDSDAEFLLTGDNDLLVMGSFGNTKIITFIDFMKVHFKYGLNSKIRSNGMAIQKALIGFFRFLFLRESANLVLPYKKTTRFPRWFYKTRSL